MRRLPVAVAAQHHLALCGRGRQAGCDKVLGSVEPDAEEMDAVVAAINLAHLSLDLSRALAPDIHCP